MCLVSRDILAPEAKVEDRLEILPASLRGDTGCLEGYSSVIVKVADAFF